ncbi:MAG TPA: aconitate hydratase AcnA [Arenicellales bacterium]|nr:aconitate hydratase AcnA [Arenicellales bacterium]
MKDTFGSRETLDVGDDSYEIRALDVLNDEYDIARLPYSLKILLENLLRNEDDSSVSAEDIRTLAGWDLQAGAVSEIAYTPARVLMQDLTGVPSVVDLAAMREAMTELGGDPDRINPLSPADMVIDHSVMVDHFGSAQSLDLNAELEYSRNRERYSFLRWGQQAFSNFSLVPPATGIVHQVNIEYLARVVFSRKVDGVLQAYPDTVVGTDSHTTMVNGLGVLGWGVGGIEAEAAMLGQPISMLIPQVVGFELQGELPEGATATDLVLTVVEILRQHGVVGKFVEFYGSGLDYLSLADQATIANMAPEYGATCGIFPIDSGTLNYLRLTGRPESDVALVEAYARRQGMFRDENMPSAQYTDSLNLELSSVVPSIAGPKRPQDRISLSDAKRRTAEACADISSGKSGVPQSVVLEGQQVDLKDQHIVIAAITSCTNTSNPGVIVGAGLVARNALAQGLNVKPWVKTSLAPGSKVVTDYLTKAGLLDALSQIGFDVVGYGCTTCIGNSGPLPAPVSEAIQAGDLVACSVLSGNRNFEGRVHAEVKMNFLASPPLVVAYALAGTMAVDFETDPLGTTADGRDVYLRDIWPAQAEIEQVISSSVTRELFEARYSDVFTGDARWSGIKVDSSSLFKWDTESTYVRHPPYFEGMTRQVPGIQSVRRARVLAKLGDSITTDHISPAGAISPDSPAADYLRSHGVAQADFNSYGSRRGNHEVMMRGTFANIRLRNELAPGTEGGWTCHQPSGEQVTIYDAAIRYRSEGTPLMVIAGKAYGTGSSRDWAAKGSLLLGVRAVLVESFERIHRSNLVGMGVLPLQFHASEGSEILGLSGHELYDLDDLEPGMSEIGVTATDSEGGIKRFSAIVRIDTPKEWEYFDHGGILQYVMRQLLN